MEFEANRRQDMDGEIVGPAGVLAKTDRLAERDLQGRPRHRARQDHGGGPVLGRLPSWSPVTTTCGNKASYNNDENLVIDPRQPRSSPRPTPRMSPDVFEHYRWRWYNQRNAQRKAAPDWVDEGAKVATAKDVRPVDFFEIDWTPDKLYPNWQDRYFDKGRLAMRDREFWSSDGAPLTPLVPKPRPGRYLRLHRRGEEAEGGEVRGQGGRQEARRRKRVQRRRWRRRR